MMNEYWSWLAEVLSLWLATCCFFPAIAIYGIAHVIVSTVIFQRQDPSLENIIILHAVLVSEIGIADVLLWHVLRTSVFPRKFRFLGMEQNQRRYFILPLFSQFLFKEIFLFEGKPFRLLWESQMDTLASSEHFTLSTRHKSRFLYPDVSLNNKDPLWNDSHGE